MASVTTSPTLIKVIFGTVTRVLTPAELGDLLDAGAYLTCPTCRDSILWCPQAIRQVPGLSARRADDDRWGEDQD